MDDVLRKSQLRIKKSFEKGFEYHHLAMLRSEKFLRKHDSERLPFFVLYVDLVGSTKMSSELDPGVFNIIIRTFSQEMAYVIEQFDGYVLKFVGDAVLGFFASNRSDYFVANKIVACMKMMLKVVDGAINPVFEHNSYPKLQVKVTVDYGDCSIVRYGSDKHKSHIDLIGLTLNLAAKMQQVTKSGQVTIGEHVYEKLRSSNKEHFAQIKSNSKSWKYHGLEDSRTYRLYKSRLNK